MKKPLLFLCLCLLFLTGLVGIDSPVLPSKSFYISDHADIISIEYKDAMLKAAKELYENTGAQLVLLTVEGFGGSSPEDYAMRILKGWEIGGAQGNGILMLVASGEGETCILPGEGLAEVFTQRELNDIQTSLMGARFSSGDYDAGTYDGFEALLEGIYASYGVKGQAAVRPAAKQDDGFQLPIAATLALGALIALRMITITMKSRKRYTASTSVYSRRSSFTERKEPRERGEYFDDDYPSGFGGLGSIKDISKTDDGNGD